MWQRATGNATTIYDPVNRMQTLTDAAGRTRTTSYDDRKGEVRVETAPQGLVQVVRRDGAGRVVFQELTGPDIPGSTGTFDYTNSPAVREVAETDPRGTVIRRKQSAFGDVAEVSVTVSGREEKTVMAYDAFGAVTQATDAEGRVTSYVTDVLGRVTQATYPGIAGSPGGVVETFVYDGAGNVTRHVDRRGVVSELTYDQHNRMLDLKVGSLVMDRASYADGQKRETHTDTNNHSTTTQFDGLRRPIRITDARNQTVEMQYDGENLTGKRDRRGNWTYFQNYDGVDRVRVVRDREGKTSTAEYDDRQRLVRLRDRNGHTRTEVYDALGRLKQVEDEEGLIARYEYDPNGNQVGMIDGRNHRTGMVYDEANRVKQIEHPVVAGRSRQIEQFEYDRVGNVTAYFDGFGTSPRMRYRYNGLNQLEEEERTNDQGTAEITRNGYFGDGRLKERTEPKGAAYRTQFEYNDQGSLRLVTDANAKQWEYRYDDGQNLQVMRDPLGREVKYQYDELNRLREVMQPQNQRTQYDYDENGNLKLVVNGKGEQILTGYSPEDRVRDVQYLDLGRHCA